jgi:DNA gyrase subunit B
MLQSAEVGTLITALGCGIGRAEFDANNLRYHRIIIMTDADVDGSHIRTLLLTFFYRQMPELIERGHIFIAQPPLYKLKRGKKENYVKDDAELNALLLSSATDDAALHPSTKAAALPAETLAALARDYMESKAIILRWGRRYDAQVLEAMMALPEVKAERLATPAKMREWCAALEKRLGNGTGPRYRIQYQPGTKGVEAALLVTREHHGHTTTKGFPNGFFSSPEYQRIAAIGTRFQNVLSTGAYVLRDQEKHDVATLPEAIEWLMARAKEGQTIQRYKGLGEMNPDQLWETTVNPETRRLLQVRIEDAVAADEIFTTLMGDQVEPRREFIERNALAVANLDI